MPIGHDNVREHTFLRPMLRMPTSLSIWWPKAEDPLRQLAERIEREAPEGGAVYELTQVTT